MKEDDGDTKLDKAIMFLGFVVVFIVVMAVIVNINWMQHIDKVTTTVKETIREQERAYVEKENAEKIRKFVTEDSLHRIAREILNSDLSR